MPESQKYMDEIDSVLILMMLTKIDVMHWKNLPLILISGSWCSDLDPELLTLLVEL